MAERAFELKINTDALREQVGPLFVGLPRVLVDVVLLRTINRTGDMVRTRLTKEIAKSAGIPQRESRVGIEVQRATPATLQYRISVASQWVADLMYVTTLGDERVCPYCVSVAHGGPYTKEQLDALWTDHAPTARGGTPRAVSHHKGLLHWGCTCVAVPAQDTLREQLSSGGSIAESAIGVVKENAGRIFTEEYRYAVAKMKRDKGLG